MYAAWYEQQGPAEEVLHVGEMEMPVPGPGEVLVRVRISGITPSDAKRRRAYRGQPMGFARIIPHSDGSGVIAAVGSEVASSRVGERVWLWNAQFGRPFGTAAEYVVLPAAQAVPLPDHVDFEIGACLGIPALTAHRALFADGPIRGQTILIAGGAGTVGHAAIQLAKWAGATVISTVSSAEKGEVALAAGADVVLNYQREDVAARIGEITRGQGVDRIVEVALGPNMQLDTRTIKPNGVIAAYDSESEAFPPLPFFELMVRNITLHLILVYTMSATAHEQAIAGVSAALEAGALRPLIGARFPLEEIVQAHQTIEHHQHIGNVILDIAG
ncbi:alcohol dehydrogenase [Reticulibacter mediterranei]|uniref:Alcohol dehydrogenase n=1 Tax=Reticulibacter mediterranei TaxID=2778369 RepID=A0A8J3IT49_9CHLR|nr:NADPH:quinone reductase [Reticulibacter mediterranei]GHP00009.1 alcohol dehydrogenase [Reticulibacter mediterranei]